LSADPDGWVTLVCPLGAENGKISHGAVAYEPYREDIENPRSRWLVKVPKFAAIHFCRVGGFVLIEAG
jgi:hypothetical protein